MLKKSLFISSIFTLFILISCTNITGNVYSNNSFSFSIGKEASDSISSVIKENENITGNTILTVNCQLLQGGTVKKSESKDVKLDDLEKTSFSLTNILNGNDYYISLQILYTDIVIYRALSDKIAIREDNEVVDLSLNLEQNNCKIEYNLNEGDFVPGQRKPLEYFITSDVEIPSPVKAHCQFDGWYRSQDYKPDERITKLGKSLFLGDVTLHAKWIDLDKVQAVKITSASLNIDCGDEITLSTGTPGAIIHYTTDGSQPDENSDIYSVLNISESMIRDDKVTIKAVAVKDGMEISDISEETYTRKRYTVKFDNGGHGTAPGESSGKIKGDRIGLKELTENKMHFLYWNVNGKTLKAGEEYIVDGTDAENCVINIRAVWEGCVEPVTFSLAAGAVDCRDTVELLSTTSGATIYYTTNGDKPTLSSTIYSKPISIEQGQTIKAIAVKDGMYDSVVCEAAYTIKTYTVTFDINGHGSNAPSDITGKKYDTLSAPSALSETGYIFGNWYKESSCTNEWNFTTDKIGTSDITLYAKWTPVTYKVNFDGNGSTSGSTAQQTLTYDKQESLNTNGFSRTGYIFNGWNTKQNGSGTNYTDKQNNTFNLLSTNNDTITLYAQWTPITYKVSYNINEGDEGTMAEQDFTYDVSAPLRKNTFTKSGYRFEGWGTSASGNVEYNDEKSVQNLSSANNGTVTLYAIWENIAPGPVTGFTSSINGDQIHLAWTNPTEKDVSKVVINSTDAGITNQEVDVSNKYGQTGSVDVAIGSGNLDKGTYNFTAKTVDKENLECIGGDVKSGSITLPTIDDFSVPNGLVNKSYTVVVTGTNFQSASIGVANFKVTASGKKVTPSAVTVNSDTELQFNIPASGSAVNDTISVSCIGATSKQDNVDIKADYAVGDIVMTDDTLLTGNKCQNYKGKAKPVAIIFRARAGGSSALGLGFYFKNCIWAKKDSPGYNKSLSSIATTPTNEDADKDGSDNWELLKKDDPDGSKNPEVNYPAFYYSNSYGNNFAGTSYSSGWYLPSLGELIDIGKAKDTLKSTLSNAKNYVITEAPVPNANEYIEVEYANSNMWSSNQSNSEATKACGYHLYPNNQPKDYKDKADDGSTSTDANCKMHACAVRKF